MRRAGFALFLLMATCDDLTFRCDTDEQCGPGGSCQMGACAFADSTCSSGLRWDKSAEARDAKCVPDELDMGLSVPPADLADSGDASAPADLSVLQHFYPELQAQVESYHCPTCHSGATPEPRLVLGDTVAVGANARALQPYVDRLIDTLQRPSHCAAPVCVPNPDLVVWQRWIVNPAP